MLAAARRHPVEIGPVADEVVGRGRARPCACGVSQPSSPGPRPTTTTSTEPGRRRGPGARHRLGRLLRRPCAASSAGRGLGSSASEKYGTAAGRRRAAAAVRCARVDGALDVPGGRPAAGVLDRAAHACRRCGPSLSTAAESVSASRRASSARGRVPGRIGQHLVALDQRPAERGRRGADRGDAGHDLRLVAVRRAARGCTCTSRRTSGRPRTARPRRGPASRCAASRRGDLVVEVADGALVAAGCSVVPVVTG